MAELTEQLSLRLTPEESDKLAWLAEEANLTKSDILRILIHKAKPNPIYFLPVMVGDITFKQRILLFLGGESWIKDKKSF